MTSSAFAAPGRAFTCAPGGTQFSDAHCKTAGTGFGHTTIANGVPTNITGTNAKTAEGTTASQVWKLKGSISGVIVEIQCTEATATGTLTNSATSVSGTMTITCSGTTVTIPTVAGCEVTGGSITTNLLAFTTAGLTNSNEMKISPASGTTLATIPITGCMNLPHAGNYPLTGSLIAKTSGATVTTTHAEVTTQVTLRFAAPPAGLESAMTLSMEGGNPIVLT